MLWSNGACFCCSSPRRISPLCLNLIGRETLQFFLLSFPRSRCIFSILLSLFFPPSPFLSSHLVSALSYKLRQLSFSIGNPYWHTQRYAGVLRQEQPDRTGELAWLAVLPPFLPLLFSLLFVCRIAPLFWHSGGESTMTPAPGIQLLKKNTCFIEASGENASNARLGGNS